MQETRGGTVPTAGVLLRIWAEIGLQSFGGGASTLLLIQRAFVERRAWIEAGEMLRMWNLCQLTPGINLIALTVLIGRKLGGTRGIVASLAGLLVPSATVTCLLAAGFAAVQHSPAIHAVLRGVIPATAGIMAVVALNFARPPLKQGYAEGRRALGISVAVIVASAAAIITLRLPVIVVLAGVAVLGALIFTPSRRAESHAPRVAAEGAREVEPS